MYGTGDRKHEGAKSNCLKDNENKTKYIKKPKYHSSEINKYLN